MKILVITFSTGMNPGTFMQAFGVKTGLLKIYPEAEVEFLNFPNFKTKNWEKFKAGKNDSILTFIRHKGTAVYRLLKYKRAEHSVFKHSRRIDMFEYDKADAQELLSHYDLVCVGSDTILEEAVSAKSGQYSLAWSSSTLCKAPHIFFAASASPAHFADESKVTSTLKDMVKGFKFIGLRDGLTVELFRDRMGIDANRIVKQPDPSYLLDVDKFHLGSYYTSRITRLRRGGRKIALCNFGKIFPYRKELAEKLKNAGYSVITSAYSPYADLCITTISPVEWAGMFRLCDVAVTERFHDSVFAIRNGCPVIAVDWQANRISETGDSKTFRILQDYGLERFHYSLHNEEQLDDIVSAIPEAVAAYKAGNIPEKVAHYIDEAHSILREIGDSLKSDNLG